MDDGLGRASADADLERVSMEEIEAEGATSLKEIVRKRTQTLERDLIERALEETGGNVTRAAEKLGLSRKGLQLKIKELGLKRDE